MPRQLNLRRGLAAAGLAACALAAATSAHAVDLSVDWGNHGPARLAQANPGPEGSFFNDAYAFSLGAGSWTIASTVVANELMLGGNAVYSIIGGVYGLYADPDGTPESGDEALIGTDSAFNGTTGELSMQATVGQGRYYYLVTGLAAGTAGGAYQLSSAVAAVPEPASAALLLAGAAVVGGIATRRRRSQREA
ncbi:FxDxF family PEP-CTERM protein [Aquincola tertiaricarbonis]|uniref:FxDxF family PEP-CTERM protein n=1 Tax=Aquincola tertiaricarbonis TaxID=391953 RepID=A0ABY4S327_AQUTE|nr:FxDxF family PEP-CTERM protein [Aquincola tertiaricarbonis]URI06108.1 FxDxF family PEP-CTERM protein [Aquincola tertiaricarbonis]